MALQRTFNSFIPLFMEVMDCRDYREYLKSELERRVALNAQYSLRAFARDLDLSPQMLSFVLNRKKNISMEVAANVAFRLSLDPQQSSHFVDLVLLTNTTSSSLQKVVEYRIEKRIEDRQSEFRSLDLEAFKVIADWHHYAILELSLTDDFESDPKWISERLGVPVFLVKQAIERLLRLELLEEDHKRRWRKTDLNVTAMYGTPTVALRKLAKQLIEKAGESLDQQTQGERDITNITMAIDPSLLPEAKRMIAQFRRKLCAFLEQGSRTEVYTFVPALFKLTKNNSENRK